MNPRTTTPSVRTRTVGLLTAMALLLSALVAPAPALAGGESELIAATNAKRTDRDIPPVTATDALTTIAQERARQLARADDGLEHNGEYVKRRFAELGVCWRMYGEIIAYNFAGDAALFINQWMNSDGHRKILLASHYTRAGGSWAKGDSGRWYAAMIFVEPCGGSSDPAPTTSVTRVAGADRYATAAAVSRASFTAGVSVAYVATGENYPDALAASAAAAKHGAPVLLVTRTWIPGPTATELRRLAPRRIVVLGGTGVVGGNVASALRRYTPGSVKRLAGEDRYATAAAISRATFGAGVPVAYVATGSDFPDALAGAPAAASRSGPVLLVGRSGIPAPTVTELKRLRPQRIVVLGPTANVSSGVMAKLDRFTTGTVKRISGANRYAVATNISATHFAAGAAKTVYIATGAVFPDGLSSGAVAGRIPGPVLLVQPNALPSMVRSELRRLAPDRVVIVGGTGAVSSGVLRAIESALP